MIFRKDFTPAKPVRIVARIGLAWMILSMFYLLTYVVFLILAPMRFWIDYSKLEVIQTPPGKPELVRVDRFVQGKDVVVPITRFIEMHHRESDGTVTQLCPSVDWTTAETKTNPQITVPLPEFVGPKCDLDVLEGLRVNLQVTYDLELPFSIHKRKAFYAGPFTISAGNLKPVASNQNFGEPIPVLPAPNRNPLPRSRTDLAR